MSIESIIFLAAAAMAVVGGTMMIVQRNPVLSVLFFILSIVAQAILYVQLGGLFLAAVLIIVYSGAIMVLFLFVIMLLNLRGSEDLGQQSPPINLLTKFSLAFLLIGELFLVVYTGFIRNQPVAGGMPVMADDFASVSSVANMLFTDYLYPFELTGILLLVAIVGAVVIARRESEEDEQSVTAPQSPQQSPRQEVRG